MRQLREGLDATANGVTGGHHSGIASGQQTGREPTKALLPAPAFFDNRRNRHWSHRQHSSLAPRFMPGLA
jgi:hypothetical protein